MSSHQGSSGRAAATAAKSAPEQRRERRLHLAVPVKVFPDLRSIDSQTCVTYEISTIGARLVTPQGVKEVGQIIGLQRQNRRARYKVVWIGKPGTPHAGQVGVEVLEPSNMIWENEIKTRLMQAEYIEPESESESE
jgi:PilZ domain